MDVLPTRNTTGVAIMEANRKRTVIWAQGDLDLTSRTPCVHSSWGSQELNHDLLKKSSSMAKIRPVLIALVENAAAVQILRSESFHKTRAS